MNSPVTCVNCGRDLEQRRGTWLCPNCNTETVDFLPFRDETEQEGYVFIECPGATLYQSGTDQIKAGVRFLNEDDPTQGHEIIDHAVYAPTHTKRRRIKVEALGRIRRCQGCQDLTVRMRRPEGPDFFIPSAKHPGRKKLKSVLPSGDR